ncbi:MAG TPA: ABC transporter permease subunit [Streptosporangiaceae bacterium]|nr:ABC transporter permease subunit [Streptosporangiaceae bacterium]
MTALRVPARPEQDAALRPVPWRQMAWVTWRQHRIALAGVAALLGAWAVYLWLTGLQIHHAYAAVTACHPAGSVACGEIISEFNFTYGDPALTAAVLLQVVPALIGAFAGAPVLARELETGTFRFAWTQGFGRWRWTLAKLVPLAVVVATAAGVFSLLFSWFFQPFFADGNETPFTPELFVLRGVAFAAWTLAAFAIGALAGMLIRRVVPAIAATLAVYAGLALAAGLWLRQHYAVPLLTSNPNVPSSAWIMSQWWSKGGKFAFTNWHDAPASLIKQCSPPVGSLGKGSPGTLAQCFTQHGYTQLTSYQPGSRFWPFQWIEGGWLLALSVLLIAATIWLVRRRAA